MALQIEPIPHLSEASERLEPVAYMPESPIEGQEFSNQDLPEEVTNTKSIDEIRADLETIYTTVNHTEVAEASARSADVAGAARLTLVEGDRHPNQVSGLSRLYREWKTYRQEPRFAVRPATTKDLDALVEADMASFNTVYRNYGMTSEQIRKDLFEKFTGRLEKIGGDWMQIVEQGGKIAGVMMCCPTSKTPEEFVSWEETTDGGTLATTYDPTGKNVYIVSLSVLAEGTRYEAQNMLFANQIGKLISEGYKRAYFESRLPGLRIWMRRQCREQGLEFDILSDDQKDTFANTYFQLKKVVNGKEVPQDRLLRIFEEQGCKPIKIVPNAYQDGPSMNYGVMCVYDNPLPPLIQRNRLASKVVGGALRAVSHSRWIVNKFL